MVVSLPDLVIRASAGTGKTYQLTNRFIRLLASGVPPEEILAATFTRKAAGEILERILLTLARAANDVGECTKLAEAIGVSELNPSRCVELLAQVTRRLHRLQVGTLDSFFAKLATSYSLELGLPPGWRILDDLEATRLKSDAIELLLESDADNDLVKLLRLLTKGAAARSVSELILENVNTCHEIAIETSPDAWRRVPCPAMPLHEELRRTQSELAELVERADKSLQKAIAADRDFQEGNPREAGRR
jgi:ATP-dependent exoDNAse (exonuclease V) beta subunit